MGQEIVYCAKCQVRIVGGDFEKGEAYRVGDEAACHKCAMQMLATAPVAVQQQILEQKKRALDRKAPAPPAPPVPRGMTGSSTAVRTPRVAEGPKLPLAAILGIAATLVILVGLMVMSGTSAPPTPPPAPPPPVVVAGQSPKDAAADGALQAAKSFARDNPSKLDEQAALFEKIVADHARTPASTEAKRELEGIERKRKELKAAELTALLSRAREMNSEYQKAADALASARKKYPEPEWTKPIDDRIKELEAAMSSEFPALRDKAVEARKRDGTAEVDLIREKVVRWGSARYSDELDKSLAEVFPPVTAKGGVLKLTLAEATLVGNNKFRRAGGEWKVIQNWTDAGDSLLWSVAPRQAGAYTIRINYAVPREMNGKPFGGEFEIAVTGGEAKKFTVEPTASWGDFKTITFGTITLPAGPCTIAVRPVKIVNNLMSLHYLELVVPK